MSLTARASLTALVSLTAPLSAHAHDRSVSQSVVHVAGREVSVRVRSRTVDLSSLSPELAIWAHRFASGSAPDAELPPTLVAAFHTHFRVVDASGRTCAGAPPLRTTSPPAELRVLLRFTCTARPTRYVVTPWPVPGHHHMAHLEGGRDDQSVLVVGEKGELPLGPPGEETGPRPGSASILYAYLVHGARHAATGWDHAAFVLLLLVLVRRAREAMVLVTGFTVGHALTLSLAALSVLESDARAVESLIAASVLLVAAENVGLAEPEGARRALPIVMVAVVAGALGAAAGVAALGYFALAAACLGGLQVTRAEATPRQSARMALAVGFGLVHGLGFASGFDATGPSRVGRLVAFNVGVELAQLGWVALGWVALSLLGRPGAVWRRRAVLAVSVVAGSGATYACVLRALSP